MTNEKKIRIFYILSIIGMVIGMITTGLCLVGFTNQQYGTYNLYFAFLTQLGVLSFGFQDGMLINYRQRDYKQSLSMLVRDLKFGAIFQIGVLILSLLIIPPLMQLIGHSDMTSIFVMILACVSFFPSTLLGNVRNGLSALGRFDIVGYFDFFIKVYLFLAILLVCFFKVDVIGYILIDIVLKFVLVIYLHYKIFKEAKEQAIDLTVEPSSFSIKDNFKKGLLVLIGNWGYVLVFTVDKTALSNHTALLGIYSYAIFIITTICQLFLPMKSVVITQVNEHLNFDQIYYMGKKLLLCVCCISLLYLSIGEPLLTFLITFIVNHFPGLLASGNDIIKGVSYSSLITTVLPLYICIHLYFTSFLVIKSQGKYALYGMINAVGSILIYGICVKLFSADILMAVIIGTIINYLFTFVFSGFILTGIKNAIKLFVLATVFIIGCVLLINANLNWILFILFIICCGYVYITYFRKGVR